LWELEMLIGLVGFIGSGKGAASDYIVEKYGFEKESFANSVKDSVSCIFNWNRELLEGSTEESRIWRESPDEYWSNAFGYELTPRKALQLMGTEVGREIFHPNIWVHSTFRRMNPDSNYVISDVRFPNEIFEIRKFGGFVFRVKRGKDPEWYSHIRDLEYDDESLSLYMKKERPDLHYSEWAWTNCEFDGTINNNYGILELKEEIDSVMNLLQTL
jgi:hypothetical protein